MEPARDRQLQRLKSEIFDLLIVGGGATGSGVALDAATRGLKTALIEADDFSSGTSSRSTKLIHGGVRYLEQAVTRFDWRQFQLVKEALWERYTLLKIAPHLTRPLPILIPAYHWFDKLYYGFGVKLYDLMAGKRRLQMSTFINKEKALELFPQIKQEGLRGGVIYYDGQFDDARMNVSIALTAMREGAVVANHVSLIGFNKEREKITSALVKDTLTGEEWTIQAKHYINAAGPFADAIREMDDPNRESRIKGSVGTHLLLDGEYCPKDVGLLIPKTADGRVLFMLPWEGSTLVGTTDLPIKITHSPEPSPEEIDYLLNHLHTYLGLAVEKNRIKAAWAGIRPLVARRRIKKTAKLVRDFRIEERESGLISLMGGKWTSYRRMAEALVDRLTDRPCVTPTTPLLGAENYTPDQKPPVEEDIRAHLLRAYGDRAGDVVCHAEYLNRLAPGYPYIEAEVIHAVREEFACTALDVLFRRTRLATLDHKAALGALDRVIELMGQELGWSEERQREERAFFYAASSSVESISKLDIGFSAKE